MIVLKVLEWIFWKYLGFVAVVISMPCWPWVLYQFWDNTRTGSEMFLLDWHRLPAKGNSKERLMWLAAQKFKPIFDFALECIERQ